MLTKPNLEKKLLLLQAKWLPTPDDTEWKSYISQQRDWRELAQVATGQVEASENLKNRATETLLAPDMQNQWFPVNVPSYARTFATQAYQWVDNVGQNQAELIAELLPENIAVVQKRLERNPYDVSAGGVRIVYNEIIPIVASKIQPKKGVQIFKHFDIRDTQPPFSGTERESGYNPLENMLYRPNVDEGWKGVAIGRLHQRIREESLGISIPRVPHEEALPEMRRIFTTLLHGQPVVTSDFMERQIGFLMVNDPQRPIVPNSVFGRALEVVQTPTIRQEFVRRQLFPEQPIDGRFDFAVHNSTQAQTARQMLTEFGGDHQIHQTVTAALTRWESRSK